MSAAMPHPRSFLLIGLALGLLAGPAWAAPEDPALETWLERSRIYQGESVRYTVEVKNVDQPGEPDLSAFSQFEIESRGQSRNNSSFTLTINGQQVTNVNSGVVFSYILTPRLAGNLIVPAPTLEVGGELLSGETRRLSVIEPQQQDLVLFRLDVERTGKYPLQPFTVRLRIFVRKLPKPYDAQDPLGVLENPLQLTIPWADTPEGLSADSLSDWLSPRRSRSRRGYAPYGFSINDLTFQTNSLFGRSRIALFDLGGKAATEADVKDVPELAGRQDEYFVYNLSRRFVPERPGSYRLAATAVKGGVVVEVRGSRPVVREIFDVGGSAVVEVVDAPEEGRPDSYSGAFGRGFRLAAEVAPRRARVGDPLTVTLTLSGQGNLAQAGAPDLAATGAVTSAFRVEAPTIDRSGGSPAFTYSVRPLSAEVAEFPPVAFSYFDLERERYVTIHTEPVPLEVEEIQSLGVGDITRSDPGGGSSREFTRAEGMFGNVTDPGRVRDESLDARWLGAYLGFLAIAFAACVLLLGRRRRRQSDPLLLRRRSAVRRARERLARASGADQGEQVRDALCGLIADACGVPEAGLTARDASDLLTGQGVADPLVEQVRTTLENLDDQRYGGGATASIEGAGALLEDLIRALGRSGALR